LELFTYFNTPQVDENIQTHRKKIPPLRGYIWLRIGRILGFKGASEEIYEGLKVPTNWWQIVLSEEAKKGYSEGAKCCNKGRK